MAQKILRCVFVILSLLMLVIEKGNGYEFRVGGKSGSWEVPSDANAAFYNQWAEMNRFQIGDTLLFVYTPGHDSVLHVTKDDYTKCNRASALDRFNNYDGHTQFRFNQTGPYYFISGVADNCLKNEKMVVIVLADRRSHNTNQTSPTPSSPHNSGASSTVTSVVGGIAVLFSSLLVSGI